VSNGKINNFDIQKPNWFSSLPLVEHQPQTSALYIWIQLGKDPSNDKISSLLCGGLVCHNENTPS
jgi:hypothetical protein